MDRIWRSRINPPRTLDRSVSMDNNVDGNTVIKIHHLFVSLTFKTITKSRDVLKTPGVINFLRTRNVYPPNLSPIHHCIKSATKPKDVEFLELLLRTGARVDATESGSPSTALHYAVVYGKFEMIKVLLSYGASSNIFGAVKILGKSMITGTPLEMALKTRHINKDERIIEILSTSEVSPTAYYFKNKYKHELENCKEEMISEMVKAEKINKEIESLNSKLEHSPTSSVRNDTLEYRWILEQLEMNEDYRTKSRVDFLKNEIDALNKLSTNHDSLQTELRCQVCMDLPSGKVFNCQVCDNPLCHICLENLMSGITSIKKCPSCRADLQTSPMIRNKLVERILSQIKF